MQAHIESLRNSTDKISELMIEREREMEDSKGREKRLSEKYWRMVNQIKKLSSLVVQLKEQASKKKLLIQSLQTSLSQISLSIPIAPIPSSAERSLDAKSQIIETLERENINMFERIGQEREGFGNHIAYLESLLTRHDIPFTTNIHVSMVPISASATRSRGSDGVEVEDFIEAHDRSIEKLDTGMKRKLVNVDVDLSVQGSPISKNSTAEECKVKSERIDHVHSNPVSSPIKSQVIDLRLVRTASSLKIQSDRSSSSPHKGGMSASHTIQLTATQPFKELVREIDDVGMPLFQEDEEEDDDGCDALSLRSDDYLPSTYNNEHQHAEESLSLPTIPFLQKAEKSSKQISPPNPLKKAKVYRKSDNIQTFDFPSQKAALSETSSFKTAAGNYVQKGYMPPSVIATSHPPPHPPTQQASSKNISATPSSYIFPDQNIKQPFKYNEVVRDKTMRKKMHGVDCPCCTEYYAATSDLKRPYVNKTPLNGPAQNASRHRVWNARPATPPGYWTVDFPSTQEIKAHQDKVAKEGPDDAAGREGSII